MIKSYLYYELCFPLQVASKANKAKCATYLILQNCVLNYDNKNTKGHFISVADILAVLYIASAFRTIYSPLCCVYSGLEGIQVCA